VALGFGCEGGSADAEGPGGGGDGPMGGEGCGDLLFVERGCVVGGSAGGDADAPEASVEPTGAHGGLLGEHLDGFAGVVPGDQLVVVHPAILPVDAPAGNTRDASSAGRADYRRGDGS
jgi:hypothetical protein